MAGFDRLDPERHRQHGFASAGRPVKKDEGAGFVGSGEVLNYFKEAVAKYDGNCGEISILSDYFPLKRALTTDLGKTQKATLQVGDRIGAGRRAARYQ